MRIPSPTRFAVVSLSLLLTACATAQAPSTPATPAPAPPSPGAIAALESRSGSSVTGRATFVQQVAGVEVTLEVAGASPGRHGAHLHATGDCSDAEAKSAGPHFADEGQPHGGPTHVAHHHGDLGNVDVGADGTGRLVLLLAGVMLAPGPHSVVGRSVIVHADADDLTTQPAGNSGARVACGVVVATPAP